MRPQNNPCPTRRPSTGRPAILMTADRYRAWHRCARFHQYRHELGCEPVDGSPGRVFESLWREALETWWRCWSGEGAGYSALAEAWLQLGRAAPRGFGGYARARLEAMLTGYHARWAGAMRSIEVLAVGCAFEGPLVDPDTGEVSETWRLGAELAVVVRMGGLVFVVEPRVTSAELGPGSRYWARLRMERQIAISIDGARWLGYDVVGCLYDVVRKPTLRPLVATPVEKRRYRSDGELYGTQRAADESPERYRERLVDALAADSHGYFKRAEVVRRAAQLDEARRDLWATASMISASSKYGAPLAPDACFRCGGQCAYFDVCSGTTTLDDETRFARREPGATGSLA